MALRYSPLLCNLGGREGGDEGDSIVGSMIPFSHNYNFLHLLPYGVPIIP